MLGGDCDTTSNTDDQRADSQLAVACSMSRLGSANAASLPNSSTSDTTSGRLTPPFIDGWAMVAPGDPELAVDLG